MPAEIWSEQTWPEELYGRLPLTTKQCSIRLLKIFPGRYDDAIKCKLVRSTLLSRCYDALSYTWGDALERRPILVNGVEVLITVNLELALRGLRKHNSARFMWIDALCINQHDTLERSLQVCEMGDIYRCAEQVIVWLGHPIKHSELITGVSTHSSKLLGKVLGRDKADIAIGHELKLQEALQDTFSRSWWSRVYVVQEVARARKDPIITLSLSHDIKLSDLARLAMESMETIPHTLQTLVDIRQMTRVPPRLRDPRAEESLVSAAQKEMSGDLYRLIKATTDFKASDPRDNIFALWTLTRGTSGHYCRPDYSISMQEVYTAATAEVIEGLGVPDILRLRWGRPERHLPSWVPDFSAAHVTIPPFPVPSELSHENSEGDTTLSLPSVDMLGNRRSLVVQATIIDRVTAVYSKDFISNAEDRIRENKWAAENRQTRIKEDTQSIRELEEDHGTVDVQTIRRKVLTLERFREDHEILTKLEEFETVDLTAQQRLFKRAIERLAALYSTSRHMPKSTHPDKHVSSQSTLQQDGPMKEALTIISNFESSSSQELMRAKDARVIDEDEELSDSFTHRRKWDNRRTLAIVDEGLERVQQWLRQIVNDDTLSATRAQELRSLIDFQVQNARNSLAQSQSQTHSQIFEDVKAAMRELNSSSGKRIRRFIADCARRGLHIREGSLVREESLTVLFQTSRGYTGIGSLDLREGDHLALIHDLQQVSVIRSVNGLQGQSDEFTFRGRALLQKPDDGTGVLRIERRERTSPCSIRIF